MPSSTRSERDRSARSDAAPFQRATSPGRLWGSSGQAAVEFALTLPIVLVMVLGVVLVGVAVRNELAVELAAREGARAAAVSASPAAAATSAATRAVALPIEVDQQCDGVVLSKRPGEVVVEVADRCQVDGTIDGDDDEAAHIVEGRVDLHGRSGYGARIVALTAVRLPSWPWRRG